MHRPSVSLVIPMYNEELNIAHAIEAAVEALSKYADDYEIIIVDDASTDASPRIVAGIVSENPRISVDNLKKKILSSVDPLPGLKDKVTTGGRINAAKAVE